MFNSYIQHPTNSNSRICKTFLLFPRKINGKVQWCKYIQIEQQRTFISFNNNLILKWIDIKIF